MYGTLLRWEDDDSAWSLAEAVATARAVKGKRKPLAGERVMGLIGARPSGPPAAPPTPAP